MDSNILFYIFASLYLGYCSLFVGSLCHESYTTIHTFFQKKFRKNNHQYDSINNNQSEPPHIIDISLNVINHVEPINRHFKRNIFSNLRKSTKKHRNPIFHKFHSHESPYDVLHIYPSEQNALLPTIYE
jgi:hypothetical protein